MNTSKQTPAHKQPRIMLGSRTNNFKQHEKPRLKFRQYTVSFREYDEEKEKEVVVKKKFKYLKAARTLALEMFRQNAFISLYNHNGIPLCI